ncbi:hypothetical protein [Calidithermus roseus]|uniref:Putative membrane-bound dehydrogenase domain protein n=1 Tax=Calidithermus roseus TaxID=1644118 RepID=A0A399F166_9DEIN|nr:hypothetical protein [Calidithermus roseus]RIH89803.1 putative membrane-bound dehydrogenase domain protein [Calidithermus roseus]
MNIQQYGYSFRLLVLLSLILVACTPTTGSLKVNIAGLPAGTDARVTVSKQGGGYSREVKKSEILNNLSSGTYQISVSDVSAGGYTYSGTASNVSVKVEGGKQAEATVNYVASTGSLAVNITGLPEGTGASVAVSGPGGFSRNVTASTTLTGLAPGDYNVNAATVSANGFDYGASINPNPVKVSAGATASIQVSYGPSNGQLTLSVSGIPSGASASVTVNGVDGGFSQTLVFSSDSSQSLAVPIGQYNISANSFTAGGTTYAGTVSESPVSVTGASTKTVSVTYSASSGNLQVNVSGLPSGSGKPITISGPSGSFTVGSRQTRTGLAPGNYTVTAADVLKDGSRYAGTVTTSPVTVSAGATALVDVSYSAITGRLVVNVSGLPGGVNANVSVSGPGGFSQNLTASATFDDRQPGTYIIAASDVLENGSRYTGSVNSSPVTVSAGATASVSVGYTAVSGRLVVTINGLPTGTNASVNVSGPGLNQTITSSTTFDDQQPGTYTLSVNGVTVSQSVVDEYYQGNNTSATVTAGSSASASVSYGKYGSGKLWVIEYGSNNGTPSDPSDDPPSRLLGYDQGAGTQTAVSLGLSNGSQKARGMALDKAGNLWVGIGPEPSGSGGEIRMYRAADLASPSPSPAVTITSPDLGTPRALAFDSAGNLWVADEFYNQILRFDAGDLSANYTGPARYKILNFGGTMTTPTGLAFDASGNLWVVAFFGTNASDTGSDSPGQVLKFSSSQLSRSAGYYSGRAALLIYDNTLNGNDKASLHGPISLAFDSAGGLWVASKLGDFLSRFDPSSLPPDCDGDTSCSPGTGSYAGAPAVKISSDNSWVQPIGLAFDNAGNLWVSDDRPRSGVSLQQRLQWNPRMPYFSSGGTGQIVRFSAAQLASTGSPTPTQALSGISVPLDTFFNLPPSGLPLYGRP